MELMLDPTMMSFMAENGFSVGNLLSGGAETVKSWGGGLVILIGVVMMVWAAVKLAQALLSKQQANWAVIIIAFIIGGAFAAAGVGAFSEGGLFNDLSIGAKDTITDLGQGNTIK